MRLSRRNRNRPAGGPPAAGHSVRTEQKATKARVAAVVTLAGLVGIHLTHGTAELVVGLVQLVVVVYGVWRARNAVKAPNASRDPGRWYFG